MSRRPASLIVAAVDLGATSGRVMLAHVGADTLELEQVSRFPNEPITTDDGLRWDFDALYENVLEGLASTARVTSERGQRLASIGIDSWAVDYALLNGDRMLGPPFHYRDERTAAVVDAVHTTVPFAELYRENGLQFLPFNTLYQLSVDRVTGRLAAADAALLIPDLIAWRLTGARVAEATNASTTGLLSSGRPVWNDRLIERLGLPRGIFPPLVEPGTRIGTLLPPVAVATGLPIDTPVTAVGSHDTASAVVGVPMTNPNAAYISCGTWGLVGVELDGPVITDAGRRANFTNEGGVDGRTRFLRNVMGLWLLSECMRTWSDGGLRLDLPKLLSEAAELRHPVAIFDVDDERFLARGDMPTRIATYCVEHHLPVPHSPAEFTRSILVSLADAFAGAVRTASEISGRRVEVVHMVGGGAQNELLCRLTAERCGLPVLAGPVEATAVGNALVQARAIGAIDGDLEGLRALVARTHPPTRYTPNSVAAH